MLNINFLCHEHLVPFKFNKLCLLLYLFEAHVFVASVWGLSLLSAFSLWCSTDLLTRIFDISSVLLCPSLALFICSLPLLLFAFALSLCSLYALARLRFALIRRPFSRRRSRLCQLLALYFGLLSLAFYFCARSPLLRFLVFALALFALLS